MIQLAATVSGSFHRHMPLIELAVEELSARGIVVLSPADPRVVDAIGPFLFVASDQSRSVRLVQDKHLSAIAKSDFLWLITPDGYVGQSACLEIGFAIALSVPVYSKDLPKDLTIQQYIRQVNSIDDAVIQCRSKRRPVANDFHEGVRDQWGGQIIDTGAARTIIDPRSGGTTALMGRQAQKDPACR